MTSLHFDVVVIDGSVMSANPGVNPSLTITALDDLVTGRTLMCQCHGSRSDVISGAVIHRSATPSH